VYAITERCFPETGQCIDGRFRQFWEVNGGLSDFGYPITAARDEISRDTGKPYLTQWLERNRFEAHPENPAPYDVLLGRLGDDRLLQQGRRWQAEPREAGPQTGCLWFPQTGRNVCDQASGRGFRNYWLSHGLKDPQLSTYDASLALFGLPLTTARTETNSSGDTVLTQWFERARFEYHPNNPNPFKVLLGLLGNEVRSGSSTPAPQPPAPAPPASRPLPPPSFNNCQADPQAPNAPNYPITIVGINKMAEEVMLQNLSAEPVDLTGWTMCSIRGNQKHDGIGGTLAASETRSFRRAGPENIWNDLEEDDGALYNAQGQLVSYWND
jgi:hypothetical protein